MRKFAFRLSNDHASFSEPRISAPRPPDARQSGRRRLEDQIESLYTKARAINDLEAASDLLNLLEKLFARRARGVGRERRINRAALNRARRELEQISRERPSNV